ncbi:MAG: isochorismatase family protein [Janthinobacterium lividum]
MNGVNLPQSVVDRVIARRGTPHPFDILDPSRTALVVVDMQNGFMDDAVGHAVCPAARDIVPEVNRLAAATRMSGGGVFWIKNTFNADSAREWSVMQDMATPEGRRRRAASMSEGTPGHALWPALQVLSEDEILLKYRYSAFLPGASDLPGRLRARGFDTVLITGTVTNVCCESSARDAMMTNFRVVMVSDGNAAMTPAEHDASLISLYLSFTDLMDTGMVIERLGRRATQAAHAA